MKRSYRKPLEHLGLIVWVSATTLPLAVAKEQRHATAPVDGLAAPLEKTATKHKAPAAKARQTLPEPLDAATTRAKLDALSVHPQVERARVLRRQRTAAIGSGVVLGGREPNPEAAVRAAVEQATREYQRYFALARAIAKDRQPKRRDQTRDEGFEGVATDDLSSGQSATPCRVILAVHQEVDASVPPQRIAASRMQGGEKPAADPLGATLQKPRSKASACSIAARQLDQSAKALQQTFGALKRWASFRAATIAHALNEHAAPPPPRLEEGTKKLPSRVRYLGH